MSWFAVGQIVSLVALAWLGHASFGMPVWETVIAVALSFWLALVACRVTGETDTTPVGAMGKVTQLIFGALHPGNVNVNLMSANITAGAATSSADLLTDLKSGYLLGANPRQQFLAQFSGIFVGTVVSVLTFAVLVPDAQVLGTDQFPAPAAQTWSAVAIALGQGLSSRKNGSFNRSLNVGVPRRDLKPCYRRGKGADRLDHVVITRQRSLGNAL